MTRTARVAREALLWIGGTLGSLCLLSLMAGWFLNVTPLVFASGSMSPSYDAGALGIAREVPASDLEVGDVVSVVNAEGTRVTHRIVAIDGQGEGALLSLQGDTNAVPDADTYRVTSADRVVLGVPYAGYALNVAASPFGMVTGGLFVVGLLILGFGRRDDEGRGESAPDTGRPRRARVLVPLGLASMVVLGGALGASGQAPWAFTSAYWTDTATATTTATTPAFQGHAQPSCVETAIEKNQVAQLSWTDVNDQYEYVWSVRNLDGSVPHLGNPAVQLNGVLGGSTTQGQVVRLDIPTPKGQGTDHKKNFDVWVTTRVIADPSTTGPTTKTPIRREEGQGGNIWPAKCGYYAT